MPFVADASMTLSWYLEGEATPYSLAVEVLLEQTTAVVPGIWPLEVTNVLIAGERRRRLTPGQTERILDLLRQLPIEVDQIDLRHATGPIAVLARSEGVSVYDASYLELAARRGLSLATLDTRLRAAAERLGVPPTGAPGPDSGRN